MSIFVLALLFIFWVRLLAAHDGGGKTLIITLSLIFFCAEVCLLAAYHVYDQEAEKEKMQYEDMCERRRLGLNANKCAGKPESISEELQSFEQHVKKMNHLKESENRIWWFLFFVGSAHLTYEMIFGVLHKPIAIAYGFISFHVA